MSTAVQHSTSTAGVKRWGVLGAAAAAWIVLYTVNLPWWNWLIGSVIGLDLTSRIGSGVHFFFYDTVKIVLLLGGIIFVVTCCGPS